MVTIAPSNTLMWSRNLHLWRMALFADFNPKSQVAMLQIIRRTLARQHSAITTLRNEELPKAKTVCWRGMCNSSIVRSLVQFTVFIHDDLRGDCINWIAVDTGLSWYYFLIEQQLHVFNVLGLFYYIQLKLRFLCVLCILMKFVCVMSYSSTI